MCLCSLRDSIIAAMLESIANGTPYTKACAIVGIDASTWREWIRLGYVDSIKEKSQNNALPLTPTTTHDPRTWKGKIQNRSDGRQAERPK